MVIDSSAIIAILFAEQQAEAYVSAILADPVRLISTATVLELSIVAVGRKTPDALERVDKLLRELDVVITPMDQDHLKAARTAFLKYGKGQHKAGLNFGDCMSYALAKTSGEALLFKGTDFGHTDIAVVDTTA